MRARHQGYLIGQNVRFFRSHRRSIEIDSYEVTIFPTESVKHTQTLPATK